MTTISPLFTHSNGEIRDAVVAVAIEVRKRTPAGMESLFDSASDRQKTVSFLSRAAVPGLSKLTFMHFFYLLNPIFLSGYLICRTS
jgi:hypothetical protein